MKKDLTKHTRSAWKQPVWWKYIVAFFIILINALPLYVLIEMSLKQSTDLASRLTWPDYLSGKLSENPEKRGPEQPAQRL